MKPNHAFVLYDLGNSAYHLMIPSVIAPLYFRSVVFSGQPKADTAWAVLVAVPVLLAGLLAPFIGAQADARRSRRRWLGVTTAIGGMALATLALAPGTQLTSVVLFVVSYTAFTLALGIYDSFLRSSSPSSRLGTLSGLAWGVGYLGGIVAIFLTLPLLRGATLPEDARRFQMALLATAILYLVIAGSAVYAFPRDIDKPRPDSSGALRTVFRRLRRWREQRKVFRTIASYYLAADGLATLIYFTSIYAAVTLNFTSERILSLFLIVQLVGVPATIIAGRAADKHGARHVLVVCLAIWVALTVGYATLSGTTAFYVLSVGTGLVIGSTPAVYRALLANRVEEESAAEVFGFNSFASRASAVIGPLLFGAVTMLTGSQRAAMLSLLLFFGGALLVLLAEGREASA